MSNLQAAGLRQRSRRSKSGSHFFIGRATTQQHGNSFGAPQRMRTLRPALSTSPRSNLSCLTTKTVKGWIL